MCARAHAHKLPFLNYFSFSIGKKVDKPDPTNSHGVSDPDCTLTEPGFTPTNEQEHKSMIIDRLNTSNRGNSSNTPDRRTGA
jgi:hypothetical protein